MAEEKIENVVYFGIYGFECDVKVIADIMQIDGYRGLSKGDPKPYRRNVICEDGLWEIKSPLEKYKNIEEHISWVLDLLSPKLDKLKMVYQYYGASSELSISINNYNLENTGLHLNRRLIEKVSILKAAIDIDIYNFVD